MPESLRLCRVTRENSSDLVEYAGEFADAGEAFFVLPGNDPEASSSGLRCSKQGKTCPRIGFE